MAREERISVGGRRSAGLLLYRLRGAHLEVLLGHMGGPFWTRRDVGAWTIPKGEYGPDETPLAAARREFAEELGMPVPKGRCVPLGLVRQAGGKQVTAWAVQAELDPDSMVPGTFTVEWPPRSGVLQEFPELDKVRWLSAEEARRLVVRAQSAFVDRLVAMVTKSGHAADSASTSTPGPAGSGSFDGG